MPRDENDVSVERGEFVTVLNKEDHEWYVYGPVLYDEAPTTPK